MLSHDNYLKYPAAGMQLSIGQRLEELTKVIPDD
jgi:hypothetical protein